MTKVLKSVNINKLMHEKNDLSSSTMWFGDLQVNIGSF